MDRIHKIRKEYSRSTLSEGEVAKDPIAQFAVWWEEAVRSEIDEVNAMTLATASSDGIPGARIVLLKGFDKSGFKFFSNYNSFKGRQMEENPRACLVFFWKELERQVRVTGLIEKLNAAESDVYYQSRPEGSRIGAWASPQSQIIPGRDWLEEQVKAINESDEKKSGRPPFWGGYRVKPICMEFWQGRKSRLHDRIQYTLQENGYWKIERLAP